MVNLIRICVVLISVICFVNSARILGIFHMNGYSHYILGDRLLKALAARGHEVTVITTYEEKTPIKNFKQILLTGNNEKLLAMKKNMFARANLNIFNSINLLHKLGGTLSEDVLNHPNVQKLLKSDEQFDVVIHENFLNDAFSGFSHKYKAPSVVLSTVGASRWTNPRMGNPTNPSYIPDVLLSLPSTMDFCERAYNSFIYLYAELYNVFFTLPQQNQILQKYFPGAPALNELLYNTSLMLLNSHVSISAAVPLVPNMIEIGGYHVEPAKPLPKDLQDYLDNSKDGVIFFSMGSNLKSKDMPESKRNEILRVFGKLKQKVLWKWEEDVLPGQPSNVKLSKWLPQQDILAHPNIKLFITHGGLLSTIEAIHHGVPVLGIPVFGDQESNVKNAEHAGYGLGVPYSKLNEDSLSSTIEELLSNPKYAENAKRRSKIMHDQPTKPLDRAVYWIEYIIRHKGAPHLRTAALNLSWYQYLLLDVTGVLIVGATVVLWILFKIVKLLCCSKRKSSVNKKKKTN